MANWYDDGIQGQVAYGVSSGVTEPAAYYGNHFKNLTSPHFCDSIALNANIGPGNTHRILLNTFSLGTQLYCEISYATRRRTAQPGQIGRAHV